MKPKFILIIGSLILVILLSSCSTTMYSKIGRSSLAQQPFDIRIAHANEKQAQDYHRSKNVGVISVAHGFGGTAGIAAVSDDQKSLVRLIGAPEYERSFPNQLGKSVVEWIYLEQDYLAQFIYGKLVYLGPVDDKEKTLIELGPPDDIESIEFAGMRKEIFRYKSRFEIRAFHNDILVVAQ